MSLRKGGALALGLAMLAGPVLMSVAPVAAIAAEKCCQPRPMADCGARPSANAKSCCPPPATPQSLGSPTARLYLGVIADISARLEHSPVARCIRFLGMCGESPPESPPGSIFILRI